MIKLIIALLSFVSFKDVTATLESSCTVCNTQSVDFSGSGYKGNRDIDVSVFKDGQFLWGDHDYTKSLSDGTIDFNLFFQWGPGTYRVEVWERRVQSRYIFMASINITIQ